MKKKKKHPKPKTQQKTIEGERFRSVEQTCMRTVSKFINFILHDPGLDDKPIFDVKHCPLPKLVQDLLVLAFKWKKLLTEEKKKMQSF